MVRQATISPLGLCHNRHVSHSGCTYSTCIELKSTGNPAFLKHITSLIESNSGVPEVKTYKHLKTDLLRVSSCQSMVYAFFEAICLHYMNLFLKELCLTVEFVAKNDITH